LYAWVERFLVDLIRRDLSPGDRLATEDQLIEELGVSRITVRRAVSNLVARGLVVSQRGKGTFVAFPRIEQPLTALTGFVEDMARAGRVASARVLVTETVSAPPAAARHLEVAAGSPVVFIERVRLADGLPVSVDQTYLLPDLGAQVAADDLEAEPIFDLLEQKYGIPLVEADYRLESVAAAEPIATALQVAVDTPTLLVERTSYTTGGRPVDFERLHYRGDAIAFVTKLRRATR
jgi:GntR family transcriptional regulator